MNPALAIQSHLGGTQASVAAVVGEHRVPWGKYLDGTRNPTAAKLELWAERANITMKLTPGKGWSVTPGRTAP